MGVRDDRGAKNAPNAGVAPHAGKEMATRKMDADQFRELLQHGSRGPRAPTVPASAELIDELVARSATPDPDDDDLAIPVAPREDSKPIKPQARVVEEQPRPDRRHAGAIAPITKPPPMREPRAITRPRDLPLFTFSRHHHRPCRIDGR